MLFLFEVLGPSRAEQFKRTHLGFKPSQTFMSPPRKTFQEIDTGMLSEGKQKKLPPMLGSRTSFDKNSNYPTAADALSYKGDDVKLKKRSTANA